MNTERLHVSFDQLVGPGRWVKRSGLGTFPIRFPNRPEPDDTGWHCDGSFGDWPYRLNLHSRGRALLMLFLFSDIGDQDAPTRIRVGSHLDVPPILAPAGEQGMSFLDLAHRLGSTSTRPIAYATGSAGDVYLCHPFLVHAAQSHRGTAPRSSRSLHWSPLETCMSISPAGATPRWNGRSASDWAWSSRRVRAVPEGEPGGKVAWRPMGSTNGIAIGSA